MAKLKMVKETTFVVGPIALNIRAAAIASNGDLGEVIITQESSQVIMTFKQALALANEIIRRVV